MKKTLASISKEIGYSTSTISRVLNGRSEQFRISKTTQKEILEAVKRIGYEPNLIAQSLRNNSTRTIGLIVPHIDNIFFANIASVIIREAKKYDHTVMLIDSLEDPVEEIKIIKSLIARKIDGVILVPAAANPSEIEALSQKIPMLLVDRYYEDSELPYVSTDNYLGAYLATDLLIENGHSDILSIQGSTDSITSKERSRGYIDAIKRCERPITHNIRGSEFSIQNGYIETKLALNSANRPSAIFAMSNTILFGAMKAINEHHIDIPKDISIVSFDDNFALDFLSPPITRISQPTNEMGMMAVKILMQMIKNGSTPHTKMLLKPDIIKRGSVKRCR